MLTPAHIRPCYDKVLKTYVAVSVECLGGGQPLVGEDHEPNCGMPRHPAVDQPTEPIYCPECGRDMRYKMSELSGTVPLITLSLGGDK